MAERLQKVLAHAGLASRRAAEDLIAAGAVTVNGRRAVLGQSVEPDVDRIEVNGQLIEPAVPLVYIALNKPTGYVSTARSTRGEQTVLELVDVPQRIFPVGRLDRETSGLLLLSNDGAWGNLVTHPRYGVEKEYVARVRGVPSSDAVRRLRLGVRLPDGEVTAPAMVRRVGGTREGTTLDITVAEGKKRQIRLILAAVGHPVTDLTRVRIGNIRLDALPVGEWRRLTAEEVGGLRDVATRDQQH